MAMSMGGNGSGRPELNVTPLIDILLVLLIIFMVMLPSNSHGLNTNIPQESTSSQPAVAKPSVDIVITVQADKRVRLNQESLALEDLAARLSAINASSRTIFVRADADLDFEQVAAVIDIVRGVGNNPIGLMTH